MFYKVKDYIERQVSEFVGFDVSVVLEYPKDGAHGHFSTTLAFTLAPIMKLSPSAIAIQIRDFLFRSKDNIFSDIYEVKGYLNFKLDIYFLDSVVNDSLKNPDVFAKGSSKNKSVLLEYVSANPTGPLHIGHARGAIFGSVLERVGNYLGYKIDTEYYINDAGSQMDTLAYSIYNSICDLLGADSVDCDCYKGDYISDIGKSYIDTFGIDHARSVLYDRGFDSFISELSEFGKNSMMCEIRRNLSSLNISFDSFVSEKCMYMDYKDTIDYLKSHGATYEYNNMLWIRSKDKGDEKDRVLVRDNGIPTYVTGDIIYHRDKFKRCYDKYINIWGADHHGYINRIKAAIDFLG